MSGLLEVCAVVATLAIATMAIVAVRATKRFEAAATEFERTTKSVRGSMAEAQAVTRRANELVTSLESVVPPLRRAATRIEQVGDRAMDLSNMVFDEIEGPLRTMQALVSGVRVGTRSLFGTLTRPVERVHSNGGNEDA